MISLIKFINNIYYEFISNFGYLRALSYLAQMQFLCSHLKRKWNVTFEESIEWF
jgi:hypothetical protein